MNWSEIESQWPSMKALLASHWQELSDDDLTRIDGQRDRLARALQERLGLDAAAAPRPPSPPSRRTSAGRVR